MSFATGLVVGIAAAALVGFFVFYARMIAGRPNPRLPEIATLIAIVALVVAVVALVRSGHSHTSSDNGVTKTSEPTTFVTVPATTSPPGSASTSTTQPAVLKEVTVPNVVGLAQAEATRRLQAVGLRVSVTPLPLNSVPAGFVVTQAPLAFSTVTSGALVILGVASSG